MKSSLFSVIHQDTSLPDDLTFRHGLYCLYALQQWECMKQPGDGLYAPGYFYKNIEPVLHGLGEVSRGTALRHLRTEQCISCAAQISKRSTFDHIIPLAKGGIEDLSNALVLCPRCNSSKGTKDLLDWWVWKNYDPMTLDRQVVCLYARVQWQQAPDAWLTAPCTPSQRHFIACRAAPLPTPHHLIALYGSMYAACALFFWLRGQTLPERGKGVTKTATRTGSV